ncbi:MAG: Holliday junction resolvase RuvX [Bacteroidia bacterium]|nr:Holliday junction resolvase RuvX [Bacteroidia bacterium]
MGRLLAIDYGAKRVGLAVTDPLKIIATALDTIASADTLKFLQTYCQQEEVEAIIVGMPRDLQGNRTHATPLVEAFVKNLKKIFPEMPVHLHDERFTSKMALDAMIAGGTTKKYRRDKANTDKLSAVILLQSFLSTQQ